MGANGKNDIGSIDDKAGHSLAKGQTPQKIDVGRMNTQYMAELLPIPPDNGSTQSLGNHPMGVYDLDSLGLDELSE